MTRVAVVERERPWRKSARVGLSRASRLREFLAGPRNGVSYKWRCRRPQYRNDTFQALHILPSLDGRVRRFWGLVPHEDRLRRPASISHYNVQPMINVYASVYQRDWEAWRRKCGGGKRRKKICRAKNIVIRRQIQTMDSSFLDGCGA